MNFKIAIAQISTDPGDITGNIKKIIDYIHQAKKQDADIVIFPELAIPGYMSLDLILDINFIKQNLKALKEITKHTDNILVIVGFIDQVNQIGPDGTQLKYNSAAILQDKKILAVQDKTLLPNYDVFFEDRYFSPARNRKIITFKGVKLGIQICEDLWDTYYPIKVSNELIQQGAELLINISGSPFYLEKDKDRKKLIQKVTKENEIPFIYVNTVGCQDGYDGELVFDGQSLVFNKYGQLLSQAKPFEEQLLIINSKDLFENATNIIKSLTSNKMTELHNALVLGIKDYFRRTRFQKAFIGLSGGIDSAVVACLAVDALGKENVNLIFMPSQFSSSESLNDSKELAKNLEIDLKVLPIKDNFRSITNSLKSSFKNLPFDTTEENIQARIRGILLMAHANKFGGLVISTANKTEVALGYSTLYGDMCGAIAPLADVSKLKVYELAKYINQKSQRTLIPENIIKKVPTAELRKDQSDEASLGGPYHLISPLVDEIIEKRSSTKSLYKKYPKKLVDKIYRLININEYKRRQASPGIKVTKKAFGLGRRIPIAHNFKS